MLSRHLRLLATSALRAAESSSVSASGGGLLLARSSQSASSSVAAVRAISSSSSSPSLSAALLLPSPSATSAPRSASGHSASCSYSRSSSAESKLLLGASSQRGFAADAAAALDDDDESDVDDDGEEKGRSVSPVKTLPDVPPGSRRTGLLAVKVGMTHDWDSTGARVPLTVLWVDDCRVVQAKERVGETVFAASTSTSSSSSSSEGSSTPCVNNGSVFKPKTKKPITALQVGAGSVKPKRAHGRQRGHCAAAGLPDTKRVLAEFRVSEDALLPPGTPLLASHFVPGQFVDITGTSIGKGFQGVMKRWGFRGQPATHGTSKAHRSPGGTGACQDPGRVWKGKKMAGRHGGRRATVQSLLVAKVDASRGLLWVRGAVPGHAGGDLRVQDAVYRRYGPKNADSAAAKSSGQPVKRPFPTKVGDESGMEVAEGFRGLRLEAL